MMKPVAKTPKPKRAGCLRSEHRKAVVFDRPTSVLYGIVTVLGVVGCSCGKNPNPSHTSTAIATTLTTAPTIRTSTSAPELATADINCPSYQPGQNLRRVANESLTEASGLAVSRKYPGVLWSHNDSGNHPRLFAMTESGRDLGTYHLAKTKLEDWEDLAIGPAEQPGEYYLYVGDLGTNVKERHRVSVYRLLEPEVMLEQEPKKRKVTDVVRFDFTYPDQRVHDAESLMVDPLSNDLFIVTKPRNDTPTVYRAKAPLVPNQTTTLEEIAKLTLFEQGKRRSTLVTAGDISPDGRSILIRTYTSAFLWRRQPTENVAEALHREPCKVPLSREPQGETIAFAADSVTYYTVSEGKEPKLYRFDSSPAR